MLAILIWIDSEFHKECTATFGLPQSFGSIVCCSCAACSPFNVQNEINSLWDDVNGELGGGEGGEEEPLLDHRAGHPLPSSHFIRPLQLVEGFGRVLFRLHAPRDGP